ncbi:MAG: TonB-dependent receptor [Gemmatimonadaceae bacterium]|nr:TonB-dependent receptor [Gemmatimonadaceae bacterium]
MLLFAPALRLLTTRGLRVTSCLVVAAFALSISVPLAAQTPQTGALQGRITLANGRVVANASVTVRQADGAYPRTVRSDPGGTYRIPFLPPGRYDVQVRQIGFRDVTLRGVSIGIAELVSLDITLDRARDTLPAVIITDVASLAERPATPAVTFALKARERERLPSPRDANALIRFTPGARPGQVFGGSTNQANLYQLDGVTVNQPGAGGSFLLPNIDWLEDFRVVGLGAGAEYGNFQGGLINLVTKTGTNTLQGALRTFTEQRAFNGAAASDVDVLAELIDRTEVNGELRGPLIRDKLYFFVSGQEVRSRERVAAAPGGVLGAPTTGWLDTQRERREQKYYGKLTWQATPRDILHGSLGYDNLRRERVGLTPFVTPAASTRGESPSVFFQALWQRAQSATRQFEARISGYSGRDDELPYAGSQQPSIALLDAPQVPRYVNATYTRRNTPSSLAATVMQQFYVVNGAVTHELKVGGDATFGRWREQRTRNGGLTWYTEAGPDFDPLNTATWRTIPSLGLYASADTGGTIDLDAGTLNAAVYLQDDVRLGTRLSLNLGVRLGYWRGTMTPGNTLTSAPSFTAVRTLGLDPRLGATFDVAGDRRWITKAHWGRYHQHLFALHFDRAPNAGLYTNLDYCDWNDVSGTNRPDPTRPLIRTEFVNNFTCFPGPTLSTEADRIQDYRQPYVDQLTLGFEHALTRSLRAEVLYVRRTNGNVLALTDTRRRLNWSPIDNVRIRDARGPVLGLDGQPIVLPRLWVRSDDLAARLAAGDNVPGYVAADSLRLWFDSRTQLGVADDARRHFDQLQLVLTGTWSRADVTAALAYTDLRGNFFSVSGYLDPSGNGNGPWTDPNTGINANGRLEGFAPWDLKVRASGELPWGLEGGAFLSVQTGDFWTPTFPISRQLTYETVDAAGGVVPLNSALVRSATGQSVLLEPRGARQLDVQTTVDVRLQKALPIGRQSFVVGLEVFNLLGGRAVTARNPSVLNQLPDNPQSLVGAVQARQAPRVVRLGVQVR